MTASNRRVVFMKKRKYGWIRCCSLAGALLGVSSCGPGGESGKTTFITIGTGGLTGVYYPVGGAIAKVMNENLDEYGIRASVESTGGSVYNINAVLSGDLEFGIAQSDRQHQQGRRPQPQGGPRPNRLHP